MNELIDYQKFYKRVPDKDFSPERNKAIVDKTIEEYERNRERQVEAYHEAMGERIDAAAHYLMKLERAGNTPAERYFGKKELARLQGKRIIQRYIGNVVELDEI